MLTVVLEGKNSLIEALKSGANSNDLNRRG